MQYLLTQQEYGALVSRDIFNQVQQSLDCKDLLCDAFHEATQEAGEAGAEIRRRADAIYKERLAEYLAGTGKDVPNG